MPLPAVVLGGLIAGGTTLASQGINAAIQGSMNKKTRQFSLDMYNRQRADSLSDWAMQNEYNSPVSQMQRLQEAGLNPNLVYGTGAVANSSQQPRQSTAPAWSPNAPQFSADAALQAYQDTRLKSAQYDNLKVQQTIMLQEAIGKTLDNAKKTYDKEIREQLRQVQVDMAYAAKDLIRSRQALMDSQQTLNVDRNTRESQVHEQYTLPAIKDKLQMVAEDLAIRQNNKALTEQQIAKVKAEIALMEKQGKLKDFEIMLNKSGIRSTDPLWQRLGAKILNNLGISF